MRIVSGTWGGRKLRAPRGSDTRPTSDRVRQAIFNILGAPPANARVLDLFAGTGALGLEALSRGAAHAVFVESALAARNVLGANIGALGASARSTVVCARAETALDELLRRDAAFAWIFIDPPYRSDQAERVLALLGGTHARLVAASGCIVVEHDRRLLLAPSYAQLSRYDERRYGDTAVSLYGLT